MGLHVYSMLKSFSFSNLVAKKRFLQKIMSRDSATAYKVARGERLLIVIVVSRKW